MPSINFFSLCESVLEEAATKAHLLDIARQARTWRAKYSQGKTAEQKKLARQHLIVLRDFLWDEFGKNLSSEEFEKAIIKHSLADLGLLNLTSIAIGKLK
jgi:hypothetical protein